MKPLGNSARPPCMNPEPGPPTPEGATVQVSLHRAVRDASGAFQWQETPDTVAAEAPLTLRVEGRAVAVVMRTPGHDRELAAGFLLTEGVIRSARDVLEISLCPSLARSSDMACSLTTEHTGASDPGDSIDILLTDQSAFDPDKLTRHVFTSSSCGICSKTSLTTAIPPEQILTPGPEPLMTAAVLAALPEKLRAAQPTFATTGGLHACAWFPSTMLSAGTPPDGQSGPPLLLFEDVGRHNALDKLLGHALLTHQLPLTDGVLLLSGRISFELVQKAHAARIPLIAAVGAPSSLAIGYAHAAGITLCGFVRENRFNVYTHSGRVG